MSIQYIVETVPEGQEAFYKEEGGQYILDVEGGIKPLSEYKKIEAKVQDLDTKISEFRTNNIELKKQLEQKLGSDVSIDSLIEEATLPLKNNLKQKDTELLTVKAQLEKVVLSDSVKDAAIKYGVLESAIPDVLNRAKETFLVKDGIAVSKSKQLDKDGNPLNINSWIGTLADSASHLFAKSSGAGAQKTVKGGIVQPERSSIDKINAGISALKN